jgi:P-type E1-E2 ATPase
LSINGTGFDADVENLAAKGYPALAVAAGADDYLQAVGLVGLLDPPRDDARALVQNLHGPGSRVLLVTGDGVATVQRVAEQVSISGLTCSPERMHAGADR